MARLDVTEYLGLAAPGSAFPAQLVMEPCLVDQNVAIGAAAAQSAAFSAQTQIVRLYADVACSVAFGDDPEATTENRRLAAGMTELVGVKPGQKVSVIASA